MDPVPPVFLPLRAWASTSQKAGLMNAQFGTPGDDKRTGPDSGRSWKFVASVIAVLAIIVLAIVVVC
jgi:hypothetical protein